MEAFIIEADHRCFSRLMPKTLRDARDKHRIARGEPRKYPRGTRERQMHRVIPPHAEEVARRICEHAQHVPQLSCTRDKQFANGASPFTCDIKGPRGLRP